MLFLSEKNNVKALKYELSSEPPTNIMWNCFITWNGIHFPKTGALVSPTEIYNPRWSHLSVTLCQTILFNKPLRGFLGCCKIVNCMPMPRMVVKVNAPLWRNAYLECQPHSTVVTWACHMVGQSGHPGRRSDDLPACFHVQPFAWISGQNSPSTEKNIHTV